MHNRNLKFITTSSGYFWCHNKNSSHWQESPFMEQETEAGFYRSLQEQAGTPWNSPWDTQQESEMDLDQGPISSGRLVHGHGQKMIDSDSQMSRQGGFRNRLHSYRWVYSLGKLKDSDSIFQTRHLTHPPLPQYPCTSNTPLIHTSYSNTWWSFQCLHCASVGDFYPLTKGRVNTRE